MPTALPLQPLTAPTCPVCGKANECAVAGSGTFEVECWCKNTTFSTDLLSRIPDQNRNKACICRTCSEEIDRNRTDKGSRG